MENYSKWLTKKSSSARSRLRTRSATIAILIVCLVCSLSACSSKTSAKTEEQISNDIQQQDDYFSTYDLKVDAFSVSKRQTNIEEKNDFVWCEVTASNDLFSYSTEYELTYVLYNDGWLLEECSQNNSSVTPISPPSQTQDEALGLVLQYVEQTKSDWVATYNVKLKSSLQKLSDLSYAYYFRIVGKNIYGYEMIPSDYAVCYQFNPASGWSSEVTGAHVEWG